MNNRNLGFFAIRILGVYAIIQSLPLFSYVILSWHYFTSDQNDIYRQQWYYLSNAIPFLLSFVMGIVLIVCSCWIARTLFLNEYEVSANEVTKSSDFQAICFSSVGILVILNSLPRLGMLIVNIWSMKSLNVDEHMIQLSFAPKAWEAGLAFTIQCGMGIVLFFGSRGLSNLWRRIQVAKYVKINNEEAEHEDQSTR